MNNMKSISNKSVYANSEIHWGKNQNVPLDKYEKYLIKKYVKDGRILEAGCGGGRISLHMSKMGLNHIDAFDFVESFIDNAKRIQSNINFFVADASDLHMLNDNQYDYMVYLQQILCFIPVDNIDCAIRESYRVCNHGGIAVFSFLNFKGRCFNRILSIFLTILRKIRHEQLSSHQLPWLHLKKKPNYHFWKKGQSTNYWFTKNEICTKLSDAGYRIVETFTSSNNKSKQGSIIYIVCTKP